MLDNLTGGRFDMGLGRGLRPPEFNAFVAARALGTNWSQDRFRLVVPVPGMSGHFMH